MPTTATVPTSSEIVTHEGEVVDTNTGEVTGSMGDVALAKVFDVVPDFAISLDESRRRITLLRQFVKEQMVLNEDYGIIPGTKKATLYKPGAEKLNLIFGLAPHVEVSHRIEDWDKGFFHYEVKVTLINKRTQEIEAEGVGNCNSKEKKYASQPGAGLTNTILKMAKKRALVDATLSATRASGLFTQDLEDTGVSPDDGSRVPARTTRSTDDKGNGVLRWNPTWVLRWGPAREAKKTLLECTPGELQQYKALCLKEMAGNGEYADRCRGMLVVIEDLLKQRGTEEFADYGPEA